MATAENKKKIIIGVVGSILVIGALHFVVFRGNASTYKERKENYENVKSQYESQQLPTGERDIYKFDYQTINYSIDFWDMFYDSGMYAPEDLKGGATNEEEANLLFKENFLFLYDKYISNLLDRPETGELAELTFLTSNQHWFFLNELPETASNSGTAVSDLLRNLKDTDSIIQETTEGSELWYQKEPQYRRQLQIFGLDLNRRDQVRPILGDTVALLYTLNRINLVREAVEKEEVGIFDEKEYNLFLLRLFRYDKYELVDRNVYTRLRTLNELIEIADKNGIEEIPFVKMGDVRDIKWPPREDTEEGQAEATASNEGMMMDDEFMMMEMMMMGGGRGEGMELMGGKGMAGMAAAEPEEDKTIIGAATPIEITLVGTNSNVMSAIYEISNVARHYHVDKMNFQALPQDDNKVQATLVIQSLSYYNEYKQAAEVRELIDKLIKNKNWLATQGNVEDESYTPDSENVETPKYSL